jgi:hypothetical protein
VPEIERKGTNLLASYELLRNLHALGQQQDTDTVRAPTGQISVGTEILLLEQNLLPLRFLQVSETVVSSHQLVGLRTLTDKRSRVTQTAAS